MNVRSSGTNLKLLLTGETYDASRVGTVQTNDAGQVPLTDQNIACWQVLVQADPGNGDNILVGNLSDGCTVVLRAGESITIPINNVNKVFVRTVAGGGAETVNWFAMI